MEAFRVGLTRDLLTSAGEPSFGAAPLSRLERAGNVEWERPLFVILNAFSGRRGALLLGATKPAAQCGFRLADLESRGAGAVTYRLAPLKDADRVTALRLHATARGLELDVAAAEFLLKRVARDMTALTQWLARLDRASLSAQRRLTIPFIREQLDVRHRPCNFVGVLGVRVPGK